jgi:transposase
MGKDAIVNFSDEHGIERKKPSLSKTLTEEQMEQIKFARSQRVTWAAIAQYFKEEHGMDYGETAYRKILPN